MQKELDRTRGWEIIQKLLHPCRGDVSDARIYTKAIVAEMVRRSKSKGYKES